MDEIIVCRANELRALIAEGVDAALSRYIDMERGKDAPAVMNTRRAAAYLTSRGRKISEKGLYAFIADGRIPSHKSGKSRFFYKQELDDWLETETDKGLKSQIASIGAVINSAKKKLR